LPTIKDVAEKAGVTVTTVSRVLNNRGYISELTRKKVKLAMEELNYQPNEIARSLSRKRSMMLGMIIPTIAHPFFSEMANAIENYAFSFGYKLLICNSRLEQTKEKEYIDMLKSNRVDGVIMGSHTLEIEEYFNLKKPIITFDRKIADIPYVSSDNYQGGRLAAELLIKKGCTSIAHICGDLSLDLLSNKRTEGFIDTLRRHHIEPVILQLETDSFDRSSYSSIFNSLFDNYTKFDGIFASSDIVAMNIIKYASARNISIPKDLKLIGYDDIAFAELSNPALTTIKQPIEEMSKLAVELLDKQINGEIVANEHTLPVTLIERAST